MKSKTLYILLAIVVLIIVAFGFSMAGLINESNKCTKTPFTYGLNRITNMQGDIAYTFCSCQIQDGPPFTFDNDGVYVQTLQDILNPSYSNVS